MPTLATPKKSLEKKTSNKKKPIKQKPKSLAEQRKLRKLHKISVGEQLPIFNFTDALISLGETNLTSALTELKPTQQSTMHQELKPVKVAESFDDWQ